VELPRLEPLFQNYREAGLSIVALESQRDRDRAVKFVAEKKLTYPCLETGEGEADVVREVFGINGFPTSYLIDGEGRILFVHMGFEEGDEKKLEAEIQKVLEL